MYPGDSIFDPFIGHLQIFAPLKHKSTETEFVTLSTTIQNGRLRQRVASDHLVGLSNAAIQAVVAAFVGDFDKASDIDIATETLKRCLLRLKAQVVQGIDIVALQQFEILLSVQTVLTTESID
jgi:hypothetical protein